MIKVESNKANLQFKLFILIKPGKPCLYLYPLLQPRYKSNYKPKVVRLVITSTSVKST